MMTESDNSRSGGTPGRYSGGLHDPAELQRYAAELEKLAASVAHDEKRAKELIDAFHTGSAANVEKFFLDAGVPSEVAIIEKRVAPPGPSPEEFGGDGSRAFADDSSGHGHTHVDVDINLGVVHVHVEYDKDS